MTFFLFLGKDKCENIEKYNDERNIIATQISKSSEWYNFIAAFKMSTPDLLAYVQLVQRILNLI